MATGDLLKVNNDGKVYKITSMSRPDLVYIGSTTLPLRKRFSEHQSNYKSYLKTGKKYITSFKVMEIGDAYIELLEDFSCSSKQQLNSREKFHITNNICVNKLSPINTIEENKEMKAKINQRWYQDNHDKILKQQKEYRQENKDKINEKIKCECNGHYTRQSKSKHEKTKKHTNFLNNKNTTELQNNVESIN